MPIDPRYHIIKILIEAGHIKTIRDIFIYIPKTTVYKDLGFNFSRFDRAIFDPSLFRIKELKALAAMFDVDARKLVEMAYEQSLSVKKKKPKK